MPFEIRHLQALVEVWARRKEPVTADLQRALHVAKVLEEQSPSPTHLRAMAWHLVVETHQAVGWEIPSSVDLSSCRGAAASVSHACALEREALVTEIRSYEGPVVLLGALAASRSVFGRWDLLPARGAYLVPLGTENQDLPPAPETQQTNGVSWAAPGRLRDVLEERVSAATIDGVDVLLPAPEIIAARTGARQLTANDLETLIFCGAAYRVASTGRWSDVMRIAKTLGNRTAPLDAALQLGISQWLGLEPSKARNSYLTLRRFLRRSAAG